MAKATEPPELNDAEVTQFHLVLATYPKHDKWVRLLADRQRLLQREKRLRKAAEIFLVKHDPTHPAYYGAFVTSGEVQALREALAEDEPSEPKPANI